jgi:hypothetical protein
MKGFYDQNGRLNIVYSEGNEISLCIPEEIIPKLYFRFQSQKFKLRDITDSLDDESYNEIFPGIYMRSVKSESKLKRLIHKFLKKKLYMLRKENFRDFFKVCSELEETRSEYYDGDIISAQVEYVNPQNVEQPGNLGGGGCGGCPVYNYFNCIGVLGEHDINGYYFFRDEEAIEATRKEEFFLDKCRYSTCFQTYEKILKEGYSEELEIYDQIKVQYQNERYSAGEGKHRVCVMRRFGYSNEIPMRVTRVSGSSGDPGGIMDKQFFSDNKHVLESCYGVYERLGISSDDVRDLLKNPKATIVDYLKRSKYSYEEILDHARW